MEKTWNNKAWFLVLPVLVLVAFSAAIPLMTVVNYSVQDTFGNNEFFWAGTDWFVQTLESDRFWAALQRNLLFSIIILALEIPLGIFIALNMMPVRSGTRYCRPRATLWQRAVWRQAQSLPSASPISGKRPSSGKKTPAGRCTGRSSGRTGAPRKCATG